MANSKVIQHGTRKRYQKGCRCEACKQATVDYLRKYRKARNVESPDFPHGTHHGYSCGCRCNRCVEFKHAYESERPKVDLTTDRFKHGSHRSYSLGCRCQVCGKAEYEYRLELNETRDFDAPDFPHGEMKGYKKGCRCEFCSDARRVKDSATHAYRMENNPEYVERVRRSSVVMSRKRRATKQATSTDVELMVKIYMSCPAAYEVDHIIPLSRGGSHTPENVQYLPAEVNRRKNNKLGYDCGEHALRWQDVLGWPSTTIPGMGVDSSESKCSTALEVEDIV